MIFESQIKLKQFSKMDTEKIFFSIVIPTYNREVVLDRCLESLNKQTFKNFEVLVCDDGSTDNTSQIVKKYDEKLTIRYFYNENTGGPAGPRNIGIKNAKAEWICFLDSDDWYLENRLEYISKLNLDEIDLIYHNLNVIKNGEVTSITTSRNLNQKKAYYDLLFNLNAVPTTSTCVRKKYLIEVNGFSEVKEIIGLEDFDLWIRLAEVGVRFKYLPIVLGSYTHGDDNLTLHDERQINRFNALYDFFIQMEKNKKNRLKINAALNYLTGWIYVLKGDSIKGFSYLFKALIFGSIAIKLRSINIFLKGTIYIFNKNKK